MGKLHAAYPETVEVIGVHSPKYPAEASLANVRAAVDRLGIHHPVVSDPLHEVWSAYGVRAWPTLIFVSPAGRVVGRHEGELSFSALTCVIDGLLEEYSGRALLRPQDVAHVVRTSTRPTDTLAYPEHVLPTDEALFIADTGHNRIVVATPSGDVLWTIGSGSKGWKDGPTESAELSQPRGMAFDQESSTLYVADTGNHVIRSVDLRKRDVQTIAGTGEQAVSRVRYGPARSVAISSPWDVAFRQGTLYIAVAGLHQIWSLDVEAGQMGVFAGTGHEAVRDGPRQQAWFAQPSALDWGGEALSVACPEAQAVRRLDPGTGEVSTLLGGGLFDFGDRDGPLGRALLQHPQGVATSGQTTFVADTYNDKIKRIGDRIIETLVPSPSGTSSRVSETEFQLWHPTGLAIRGSGLFIADTNNHRICVYELDSGVLTRLNLRFGHNGT